MSDESDRSADANGSDGPAPTRRTLLKASSGALALSTVGAGSVQADDGDSGGLLDDLPVDGPCPDATTIEPSMGHCEGATMEGCADDHPATVELRDAVRESLETRYPTAGALIDAGYKPYFDTLERGDESWSHWINPAFVGDATVLDPERPESVLVDNQSWRSIGVMFIATRNGEAIEPPPPVYDGDKAVWREQAAGEYGADEQQSARDNGTSDDSHGSQADRCSPWHYHAGLPGRAAWWYYQQVYGQEYEDGDLSIPCRTPCVMHVWSVDHPESVYAHDAPPEAYRNQEPADEPGFETDAEPGTDELSWDVLPDSLVPERPDERALLEFRR